MRSQLQLPSVSQPGSLSGTLSFAARGHQGAKSWGCRAVGPRCGAAASPFRVQLCPGEGGPLAWGGFSHARPCKQSLPATGVTAPAAPCSVPAPARAAALPSAPRCGRECLPKPLSSLSDPLSLASAGRTRLCVRLTFTRSCSLAPARLASAPAASAGRPSWDAIHLEARRMHKSPTPVPQFPNRRAAS